MKEYLEKLLRRTSLTRGEMKAAMDLIMSGAATQAQMGAFLVALRMKGETVDELAGGAASMREHAVRIDAGGCDVVDTCGTGGDYSQSFNISTAAAFVAAGAGVTIAKHGNRAMSSACGSADVLAELGVNIEAPAATVAACIRSVGIGFMYAPLLHPAMKHAGPVRRELGVRTIFNMLGPLSNPAGARRQVIGVYAPELTEVFAQVLQQLGSERAYVVHGRDGLDEITTTARTRISELRDGKVITYELDPMRYVGTLGTVGDLRGGDAARNAEIIRAILEGEKSTRRDIVCLNAGAAIVTAGRAADLGEGYALADDAIRSHAAAGKLAALVHASRAGC